MTMPRWLTSFLLILYTWLPFALYAAPDASVALIDTEIAKHAGDTGVYVLDSGEEALVARAWLVDNAQKTIDVQYFIWSTDNIGILAAETLLRAADRGVKVRVLVDDLLIDAPDKSLLALALHPNIDIRIYNPKNSVGVPPIKRLLNVVSDFRGINQRMHNKVLVVDGKVAITGGRNMAAEYFDYNHEYNFRDRDALVLGEAIKDMQTSFNEFWNSNLSIPVEDRFDGLGLLQKHVNVASGEIAQVYRELHNYANSPENFAPEVHAAIDATPSAFPSLADQIIWGKVQFISDLPGKNDNRLSLGGGGRITNTLARLVESAENHIVIQSPYLVLSDNAVDLFNKCIARSVSVRISTNSLASSDNLQASSGYRNQRDMLLEMGLQIYEYKPNPTAQQQLIHRITGITEKAPIFALHAKTMVIDSKTVYIGTFNFDPRSENLNTEVGVVIHNEALARAVEAMIEADMKPENSWNAATDQPDQHVPLTKRSKVRFWQLMPIKPLL